MGSSPLGTGGSTTSSPTAGGGSQNGGPPGSAANAVAAAVAAAAAAAAHHQQHQLQHLQLEWLARTSGMLYPRLPDLSCEYLGTDYRQYFIFYFWMFACFSFGGFINWTIRGEIIFTYFNFNQRAYIETIYAGCDGENGTSKKSIIFECLFMGLGWRVIIAVKKCFLKNINTYINNVISKLFIFMKIKSDFFNSIQIQSYY